jgi:hypothetical protein
MVLGCIPIRMNVFAVPSTCGEQRVPSEPLPNPPESTRDASVRSTLRKPYVTFPYLVYRIVTQGASTSPSPTEQDSRGERAGTMAFRRRVVAYSTTVLRSLPGASARRPRRRARCRGPTRRARSHRTRPGTQPRRRVLKALRRGRRPCPGGRPLAVTPGASLS